MITRLTLIFSSLVLLSFTTTPNVNKSRTIFDELVREGVLEVTLRADFSAIVDNRRSEESVKGTFTYEDEDGDNVDHKVKLELRGRFRRKVCEFPPLMLKFKKDELHKMGLSDHNDIKLVTHCVDEKSIGKSNVLKEYLAYKLYSVLTDKSYRVQLVRIKYEDESGVYGKFRRYGFLIEDTDEMAERLGGVEFEGMNPESSRLSATDENRMAVFQYMIGNEDYSIMMGRNVKMVRLPDEAPMITVPYDFDFSGFVNTGYARPAVDAGLTEVRQRAYLGNPCPPEMFSQTLELFTARREVLMETIDDFKMLSRSERNDLMAYLDSFYGSLDSLRLENASRLEAIKSTADSSSVGK